jgi:hypothetical protein
LATVCKGVDRLLDAHFELVHYPFGEAIFAIGVNNPLKVAGFTRPVTQLAPSPGCAAESARPDMRLQ